MHIEDFPVCSVAAMEIIAIPRGHALGAVVDVFFGSINPPCHRVGLSDPIHAASLWHRLARLDNAGASRNAAKPINLSCTLPVSTICYRKVAQRKSKESPARP